MRGKSFILATALVLIALPARAEPASSIDAASQALAGNAKVKAALETIKADDGATFAEQKKIFQRCHKAKALPSRFPHRFCRS